VIASPAPLSVVVSSTRFPNFQAFDVFPNHGSIDPTPRFPPPGPLGWRSPTSAVLSRRYDSLPPFPPHFVAFAWRYHGVFGSFRCSRRRRTPNDGPGVVHPVSPAGIPPWRRQGLPSSWGTSIPICTCSPTPAGRYAPDHDGACRVAPASVKTKAPAFQIVSRLNSMAFGLAVHASRRGSPRRRAGLASGRWSNSPGRASTRKVPTRGFRDVSATTSPSPKLLGTTPMNLRKMLHYVV